MAELQSEFGGCLQQRRLLNLQIIALSQAADQQWGTLLRAEGERCLSRQPLPASALCALRSASFGRCLRRPQRAGFRPTHPPLHMLLPSQGRSTRSGVLGRGLWWALIWQGGAASYTTRRACQVAGCRT